MDFKEAIKQYLDKRATEDSLFAVTYKKANKSIDECCNYIIQQMSNQDGCRLNNCKCVVPSDEEVFELAIHYYDEDDIKNIPHLSAKVEVETKVELSEEDKEEARKEAIEELKRQTEMEMQSAKKKKALSRSEKEDQFEKRQLSLF